MRVAFESESESVEDLGMSLLEDGLTIKTELQRLVRTLTPTISRREDWSQFSAPDNQLDSPHEIEDSWEEGERLPRTPRLPPGSWHPICYVCPHPIQPQAVCRVGTPDQARVDGPSRWVSDIESNVWARPSPC